MLTFGKNVIHLTDDLVVVYRYVGLFWLGISWGAHIYQVDAENQVLGELTSEGVQAMGWTSAWSKIPWNDRFGWIIWVVIFTYAIISQS